MSNARNLANLLSSTGDVKSTALDNVPASDDASALTTGTLPDGRFPATLPAVSGVNLTGLVTDPAMGGDLSGTASNAQIVANAVTDTELNSAKLDGIESGATADQTNAEIKTAYEANADTNAFSDAEQTKLAGIATSANNYSLPSSVVHESEKGALHATDALRISGHTVSLYKGDGTSESVTVPDNNTTYSVGDNGLTQKNFTSTLKAKLDGIASSATNVTNNNQLTNGAGYVTSGGMGGSQVFTSSGTWNWSAAGSPAKVHAYVQAGGGGGGGSGDNRWGGAGGSGGLSVGTISVSGNVSVTVGSGGGSSGSGGTSTFGSLTASGGGGGTYEWGGGHAAGGGGTGSTLNGKTGDVGDNNVNSNHPASVKMGGPSIFSAGGHPSERNVKPATPGWGAGGGGFATTSGYGNSANGGNGGSGVVILVW